MTETAAIAITALLWIAGFAALLGGAELIGRWIDAHRVRAAIQNGDPCVCGHTPSAHEHYRPGADCGSCGPIACPAYRQ